MNPIKHKGRTAGNGAWVEGYFYYKWKNPFIRDDKDQQWLVDPETVQPILEDDLISVEDRLPEELKYLKSSLERLNKLAEKSSLYNSVHYHYFSNSMITIKRLEKVISELPLKELVNKNIEDPFGKKQENEIQAYYCPNCGSLYGHDCICEDEDDIF